LSGIFLPNSLTLIPPAAFNSFWKSSYAFLNSPPSFEDDPVSGSAAPKTISLGAFAAGAAVGAVVAAAGAAEVGAGAAEVGADGAGAGVAGAHATIIATAISAASVKDPFFRISPPPEEIYLREIYRAEFSRGNKLEPRSLEG